MLNIKFIYSCAKTTTKPSVSLYIVFLGEWTMNGSAVSVRLCSVIGGLPMFTIEPSKSVHIFRKITQQKEHTILKHTTCAQQWRVPPPGFHSAECPSWSAQQSGSQHSHNQSCGGSTHFGLEFLVLNLEVCVCVRVISLKPLAHTGQQPRVVM